MHSGIKSLDRLIVQVITINQAWAGHPGRLVWSGIDPYYSVVAKPLGAGAMAVLVVSKNGNGDMSVTLPLELFGLDTTGVIASYAVRDVYIDVGIAVCGVLCAVCGVRCAVCGVLCAVCCVRCAVCCVLCAV